jgi:CBS domain containing-hemolysin-like protein
MNPINEVFILPANTTIHQLRKNLKTFLPYIPIFHNQPGNIVGIVYIRDLVRASDTKKLRDLCRPPWFITENTPVMHLLKEFRHHNEVVACVLDKKGTPEGFIALDDILEDIFVKPKQKVSTKVFVDVTVPANMTIEEFNLKFNAGISEEGCRTLADLFTKTLDHHPEEGETLYFPPYELTVKELTLLELKSIQVKTRI